LKESIGQEEDLGMELYGGISLGDGYEEVIECLTVALIDRCVFIFHLSMSFKLHAAKARQKFGTIRNWDCLS
jgi:hypothetical protein